MGLMSLMGLMGLMGFWSPLGSVTATFCCHRLCLGREGRGEDRGIEPLHEGSHAIVQDVGSETRGPDRCFAAVEELPRCDGSGEGIAKV